MSWVTKPGQRSSRFTSANSGSAASWRTGALAPGAKRKGSLQVNPIMVDGMLYGCAPFSSVFALDPVTGKQIWRYDPPLGEKVGGHSPCRGIAYFRAPDGTADCPTRIIIGTIDNKLTALDAKTGAKRWAADLGAPIHGRATAADGRVIVGTTAGRLMAVSATSGKVAWTAELAQVESSPLLVGSDLVVVGANDGRIYAVDRRNGERRGAYRTGGPVPSSPALAGSVVVVGSYDGSVYGLTGFKG